MNVDLEPRVTDEVKRRWSKALPNVFRCTECGKYRAIDDYDKMKGINAALFTCEDNPDPVSGNCDCLNILYNIEIQQLHKEGAGDLLEATRGPATGQNGKA